MKMFPRLVFYILIIYVNLESTASQYFNYQNYPGFPQQGIQNPMQFNMGSDFGDMRKYGSSGGMLPTINDPYQSDAEYDSHKKYYSRPEYDYDESDSEECRCSCDSCKPRPKPCCRSICLTCEESTQTDQQDQTGQSGNSLVFVPYPYPLIVPSNNGDANKNNTSTPTTAVTPMTITTTTPATTTTKAATTTTKPTVTTTAEPESTTTKLTTTTAKTGERIGPSMDTEWRGIRRVQNLNDEGLRRMKPVWKPKYGIVPIPDHLAARLMSQLREVKGLHSKKY